MSAVEKVFATYELAEMILVNLPPQNMRMAQKIRHGKANQKGLVLRDQTVHDTSSCQLGCKDQN